MLNLEQTDDKNKDDDDDELSLQKHI